MRLSQLIYVLICLIVVLIIIANIILEIYFFANFCKLDYSIDNSFDPDESILQIGVDVILKDPELTSLIMFPLLWMNTVILLTISIIKYFEKSCFYNFISIITFLFVTLRTILLVFLWYKHII